MPRPLTMATLITITVALAATSSVTHATSSWAEAVVNHPKLQVQHHAIEKQQWKILELEAQQGFDLDIKTQAHLPLAQHYTDSFTRASINDPYLDIVFSASQTLYDFGEASALINAERALQNKARAMFANGFEKQTHHLFSLAIQYQRAMQTVAVVNSARDAIAAVQGDLMQRFESGIGTITEIRRTQLSQINLDAQVSKLLNKIDDIETGLSHEYELPMDNLLAAWKAHEPQLKLVAWIDDNNLRSHTISQDAQAALRYQRDSIAAQKRPKLMANINTTLYDVTRSMSNYQIAGELRLSLPAFDSGYRDAKMASLNHAIITEQKAFLQISQQKSLDLRTSKHQLDGLETQQQKALQRSNNLALQLKNMNLALGSTNSDHAGLAQLHTQIASTEIDLINLQADTSQLLLDRVLLAEQIIHQFNVSATQLP